MFSNVAEEMDIDAIFEAYKEPSEKTPKIDVIIEHYLALVNQLKKDLNILRDDFAHHKKIRYDLPDTLDELNNIRKLSSIISKNLPYDQILEKLVEFSRQIIPHKKSEIFLVEKEIFFAVSKRPHPDFDLIIKCAKDEGILHWLWEQGHPIVVPLTDFVVYNKLKNKKGSVILSPMIIEGNGIGIYLIHTEKGSTQLSLRDLELLNVMTQQVAHAVHFSQMNMMRDNKDEKIMKIRKQLMETLKLATVGELAGGVAHEINNPLQIIMGNVQMARMGHKVEENLEIIEKQALRIANIVRGLLNMVKSNKDSVKEILEINSLITNTLNLIRGQIEKRNIKISLILNKKLPVVQCGSIYFQQILLNFLLHSKKQIGENGFIEIKTKVDEQNFVKITIKDSGVPMPKEYIDKVMDPFLGLENSTELNLGLTVSVQMIRDIGGNVLIEAIPKLGNKVTIKIPIASKKKIDFQNEVVSVG